MYYIVLCAWPFLDAAGTGVAGASASWGFYFFFYERAKARHSLSSDGPLASHHHTLAALEAGMLTVCITNPLWLIKTRMQLQHQHHASNYRGMAHAFSSVIKQEGVLGLYKGIVPALALTSHGAVQFTAYERMKTWCNHSGIAMVSLCMNFLFFAGCLAAGRVCQGPSLQQTIITRLRGRFLFCHRTQGIFWSWVHYQKQSLQWSHTRSRL
jgi:hypothetical protein